VKIASNRHARRQLGQRLVWRRNDNNIFQLNRFAQQPHHALEHQLRTERQRRLIASHAARLAAAKNDGAFSHADYFVLHSS